MKIILDESTPQKLRLLIDDRHTVVTTSYQGWSGLKNGALLDAAEEDGFDLFITADQGRMIAVVVLSMNNWSVVKGQFAKIAAAVDAAVPGSFAFVEIGHGRG